MPACRGDLDLLRPLAAQHAGARAECAGPVRRSAWLTPLAPWRVRNTGIATPIGIGSRVLIELKRPERSSPPCALPGAVVAGALAAVRAHAVVGRLTARAGRGRSGRDRRRPARSRRSWTPCRDFAPTPYPAVLCASGQRRDRARHPTVYGCADGDLVSVDCGPSSHGRVRRLGDQLHRPHARAPRTAALIARPPTRLWRPGSPPPSPGHDRRHRARGRRGRPGGRLRPRRPTTAATASAGAMHSGPAGAQRRLRRAEASGCGRACVIAIEPMFMIGGRDDVPHRAGRLGPAHRSTAAGPRTSSPPSPSPRTVLSRLRRHDRPSRHARHHRRRGRPAGCVPSSGSSRTAGRRCGATSRGRPTRRRARSPGLTDAVAARPTSRALRRRPL